MVRDARVAWSRAARWIVPSGETWTNALVVAGAFQPDVKVEDPSKRKKRAYKPRDPNAPKRPLTAYFRYLGEVRNVISDDLQKDPDKYKDVAGQPGDISKIATAKWQRMNEDEKAPYKLAYQEELKDYTKKAEEYQKAKGLPPGSLPPIDADADADADVSGIVYPDVEESPAAVGAIAKVDGADDEDDDDDEDDESSDGDSSSSESEAEEDTPPPPPKAAATPKKSALKKKVSAAPQAPTAPQIFSSIPTPSFSSINNGPVAPAPEQMTSSPSRKRKADAPEKEGAKSTKRGKKVAAAAEPEPTPAPVVAPASPEAVPEASAKKKDKKKRKGKGDA